MPFSLPTGGFKSPEINVVRVYIKMKLSILVCTNSQMGIIELDASNLVGILPSQKMMAYHHEWSVAD